MRRHHLTKNMRDATLVTNGITSSLFPEARFVTLWLDHHAGLRFAWVSFGASSELFAGRAADIAIHDGFSTVGSGDSDRPITDRTDTIAERIERRV